MTNSKAYGHKLDTLDTYEAEERERADIILAAWDSRRSQRVICTLLCCLWAGVAGHPVFPVGLLVALAWLLPDIPGWSYVQRFRYAGPRAFKLLAVAGASLLFGNAQCGALGSEGELVYVSAKFGPPSLSMGTDQGPTEAQERLVESESKCLSGEVAACITMISAYQKHGIGDAVQPIPALEKACELRQSQGCLILVEILSDADDAVREPEKIFRLLEQSCELGDQTGCAYLGAKYGQGKGVKKDLATAERLYRSACEAGEPVGCHNLGALFLREESLDASKAIEAFGKGCRLEFRRSCYTLARIYDKGELVPEDIDLVVQFYQAGCDSGSGESCVNLGTMYEGGDKVTQDLPRAEALYDKACEAGEPMGCYNLGSLYLRDDVDKNRNLALKPLHQACRAGMSASCHRLGLLLIDDDTSGQNQEEGIRYLTEACELKAGGACYALGVKLREVDPARAGRFLVKACQLGASPECKPKD